MQLLNPHMMVMLQWHLVLCRPNQHHIAQRSLSRVGCEVFLPRLKVQRQWRGRMLQDLRPVFPGYAFIGVDPAQSLWRSIKDCQGVSQIVGFGERGPATVPGEVVAGLMARCDADGLLLPLQEEFAAGDRVRIISGPFASFVTEIEKIDPDRRLHVLLDLLGRPTRAVLEPEQVTRRS